MGEWRKKYGDDDVNQGITVLKDYVASHWQPSWHTHARMLLPESLQATRSGTDRNKTPMTVQAAIDDTPVINKPKMTFIQWADRMISQLKTGRMPYDQWFRLANNILVRVYISTLFVPCYLPIPRQDNIWNTGEESMVTMTLTKVSLPWRITSLAAGCRRGILMLACYYRGPYWSRVVQEWTRMKTSYQHTRLQEASHMHCMTM